MNENTNNDRLAALATQSVLGAPLVYHQTVGNITVTVMIVTRAISWTDLPHLLDEIGSLLPARAPSARKTGVAARACAAMPMRADHFHGAISDRSARFPGLPSRPKPRTPLPIAEIGNQGSGSRRSM
jgi:hypothetical protein